LLSLLIASSSSSSSPSSGYPYQQQQYQNQYQYQYNSNNKMSSGNQRTTRPITTGTSVVGIVYEDGVMLAADTLLSYGSMAKSFNTPRIYAIEEQILLGGSGEFSDLQEIVTKVTALALEESTTGSIDSMYIGRTLSAKSLWNYLRFVMYQKRSKMNPYWNDIVVAGYDTGKPFLGVIDKLGTTLQENIVATGFGAYLVMPLLREKWRPDLSEGEARALLEDAMRVLFYRDCRASARIQIAKVTAASNTGEDNGGGTGTTGSIAIVSDPYELDHSNGWNAPSMIRAAGDLDGDGGW
jgi:20S proteasome subunit beta 7